MTVQAYTQHTTSFSSYAEALPCLQSWKKICSIAKITMVFNRCAITILGDSKHRSIEIQSIQHQYTLEQGDTKTWRETYELTITDAQGNSVVFASLPEGFLSVTEKTGEIQQPLFYVDICPSTGDTEDSALRF